VCAANSQLDTPLVWASLIVLSALGMALYSPVVLAEKRPLMPAGPEAEEKH
jgi:ABC-type nitrate/sulfonate/bicarbonate transport system permease component